MINHWCVWGGGGWHIHTQVIHITGTWLVMVFCIFIDYRNTETYGYCWSSDTVCENLTRNFGQYFWYHCQVGYWYMYISLFVLNDIEIVASSQEQIWKSPHYFKWFIACTCIALAAVQPWWRTRTRYLEIICGQKKIRG